MVGRFDDVQSVHRDSDIRPADILPAEDVASDNLPFDNLLLPTCRLPTRHLRAFGGHISHEKPTEGTDFSCPLVTHLSHLAHYSHLAHVSTPCTRFHTLHTFPHLAHVSTPCDLPCEDSGSVPPPLRTGRPERGNIASQIGRRTGLDRFFAQIPGLIPLNDHRPPEKTGPLRMVRSWSH